LKELSNTVAQPGKLPKLTLSEDLALGNVAASTHHHGVMDRVALQFHNFPTVNLFNMGGDDVDKLIKLLQMVRDYTKKGKLS
jgi:hypothetical protein